MTYVVGAESRDWAWMRWREGDAFVILAWKKPGEYRTFPFSRQGIEQAEQWCEADV